MISKLWHDPVWSKVIAGIILSGLGAIAIYFFDFWPSIKMFFLNIWEFAFETTGVVNWLLGIILIPNLLLILIVWGLLKSKPSANIIDFTNYTQDNFFSLKWRWKITSSGEIYDIYAFCPGCDYQIIATNVTSYNMVPLIQYICDDCGYSTAKFEGISDDVENKVMLKIQKNLRTNKWEKIVSNYDK